MRGGQGQQRQGQPLGACLRLRQGTRILGRGRMLLAQAADGDGGDADLGKLLYHDRQRQLHHLRPQHAQRAQGQQRQLAARETLERWQASAHGGGPAYGARQAGFARKQVHLPATQQRHDFAHADLAAGSTHGVAFSMDLTLGRSPLRADLIGNRVEADKHLPATRSVTRVLSSCRGSSPVGRPLARRERMHRQVRFQAPATSRAIIVQQLWPNWHQLDRDKSYQGIIASESSRGISTAPRFAGSASMESVSSVEDEEGNSRERANQTGDGDSYTRPASAARCLAHRCGVTGYVTQGVLGFVPVVGSCCAFRDLLANWGKGDGRGMLLNAISLLPMVGGISKTAHAIRGIKNVSQVYGAADNVVGAMLKK